MHVKQETSLVTIRRNFIEPGIGEITVNVNSTQDLDLLVDILTI